GSIPSGPTSHLLRAGQICLESGARPPDFVSCADLEADLCRWSPALVFASPVEFAEDEREDLPGSAGAEEHVEVAVGRQDVERVAAAVGAQVVVGPPLALGQEAAVPGPGEQREPGVG